MHVIQNSILERSIVVETNSRISQIAFVKNLTLKRKKQ